VGKSSDHLRISVVVAAYRGEQHIAEQLASLLEQTRRPDEILVGDDSPDDLTRQVVASVVASSSGVVRYLRNEPRRGISGNFLHLAEVATGDLIFFSDQDDFWIPQKIARLVQVIEEHPEIEVAGCNSQVVDGNLKPTEKHLYGHLPAGLVEQIAQSPHFPDLVWPRFAIYGHNICMRSSFLPIFQKMPLNTGVGHDIWLTQTSALLGKMLFVNEPLTLYRIHGDNSSALTMDTLNESFLHRLKDTFKSHDDLAATMANLDALHDFAQSAETIAPENKQALERSWRYFHARLALRRFPRPFRFLRLTPALVRDYWRLGTGWRSMLRDQIL
jgi:glycosyltransferase involved in cell wall biosynthesis